MLKKAGVVQPGASRAFLARVGKRRGVNGANLGGGWRLEVWSVELTGRMSELRENAEYLVWYVKKPVFTKKKISKEVFKLSLRVL